MCLTVERKIAVGELALWLDLNLFGVNQKYFHPLLLSISPVCCSASANPSELLYYVPTFTVPNSSTEFRTVNVNPFGCNDENSTSTKTIFYILDSAWCHCNSAGAGMWSKGTEGQVGGRQEGMDAMKKVGTETRRQ